MSEGKVNMALRLLAEDSKGGVLLLDSSIPCGTDSSGNPAFCPVRDILFEKCPRGRDPPHHVLLDCTTEKPCHDPVIFQCLTGDVIRRAAIQTHGAAGPSGLMLMCGAECVLFLVMLLLVCVTHCLLLLAVCLLLQLTLPY